MKRTTALREENALCDLEKHGSIQLGGSIVRRKGRPKATATVLPRRKDAKRDPDGHCSVCGLPWPDRAETLERHVCPPGFRTVEPKRRRAAKGGLLKVRRMWASAEDFRHQRVLCCYSQSRGEQASTLPVVVVPLADPDALVATVVDTMQTALFQPRADGADGREVVARAVLAALGLVLAPTP